MSDECCARTRLECENDCDEYVNQLKQQLEEKDKQLSELQTKLVSAEKLINFYKDKLKQKLFGASDE